MRLGSVGQLGYAVKAIEPWVDNYLAAGVGPWFVSRSTAASDFRYRGMPSAARFDVAISWSGMLQIELIAPVDDLPSPYLDYLNAKGEGLQHVCYFPEDCGAARSHLEARGYQHFVSGHNPGFAFNYYEKPSGLPEAIELAERSPSMVAGFDRLIEICRTWDGSEPMRGPFRDVLVGAL